VKARRALLVLLALVTSCQKPAPLPKYWTIPDFKLTERSGAPFESASLKGKVWVADFFFASCPGVCPALNARMAELHKAFATEDGVRFVSITTDPQNDTPAVLQEYASRFQADARWFFLTGEKDAIWQLSRDGFKLAVAESPGEREPITHSTRLVLIDRNGVARGFYEGIGEEGPARLIADICRLLTE
jgi:protein SCO1